ncbi:MAG: arsenate reductase (glutaredoxin) [Candidatus Aquirickettsiella gammari]
MTITIYHNPKCGTSRNTLALIRNSGIEPTIIEYLSHPPSKQALQEMIRAMGLKIREVMRQKESLFEELQLADAKWSDEALIDYMIKHPILINRPIVVTPLGVRLCRPSELVLDILTAPQLGVFNKEDGEAVINAQGQRIA